MAKHIYMLFAIHKYNNPERKYCDTMEHAMRNVIWGAMWNVSWSMKCELEHGM